MICQNTGGVNVKYAFWGFCHLAIQSCKYKKRTNYLIYAKTQLCYIFNIFAYYAHLLHKASF